MLRGKKTYICAALGAIATGVYLAGFIDQATWAAVMALLGFGTAAALRTGMNR